MNNTPIATYGTRSLTFDLYIPRQATSVYDKILSEFPTITRPCLSDVPVKYDVMHHICTTGPPTMARPRCFGPERLRIARQEFDHMLELGIVRLSSSNWSSPLHMVLTRRLATLWGLSCTE